MEMDGLSAQKTVQLCTDFCAYGNLGTRIKDRKAEGNPMEEGRPLRWEEGRIKAEVRGPMSAGKAVFALCLKRSAPLSEL
jgi:hypothetical protein